MGRGAPVLLLLAALGCDGERGSPDLAGDARPEDAATVDAAPPPPPCEDDAFGFGTAALPAITLDAGETDGLVICPPTPDWFALDLPVGRPFAIRVQANRSVRVRVGDAVSPAGRQPILRGVVPPGGVVVGVEAVDAAAVVRYAMTASVSVSDCADGGEPDDSPATARPLDRSIEGVVCEGDEDIFVVIGAPGARARVQVIAIEGQGVSLAALADFDGRGVPIERAASTLTRRVAADGRALFAVLPVGSGGRYRVSAAVDALEVEQLDRAGVVRVPDREVTSDGLMAAVYVPVAGLIVDALVDGELAAVGRTDADGRWALTYAAPAAAVVTVRLRASMWDAPRLVSVGPTLETPWADEIGEDVELSEESAIGRAAHVAKTLVRGMRALSPFLPLLRRPPGVQVRWTPGGVAPCGTCYQPATDHIELSGRPTDPDEWDDAIILHELAHHVAARYGRDDSPGGAHDGSPVAPALAWSEGFATATAAWLMMTPRVLDSRATGVRALDLELMDDPRAFGTANDRPDGAVSEYLVAALLWDLLDAPADDDDAEAVDPSVFFGAALTGLVLRAVDAGAPGADLLDHADEIACRATVDWPTLFETRDVTAPVGCRSKPASLLSPVDGALRVGCAGWLTQHGARRWVMLGDRVPGDAVTRLDCGAVREHFDPAAEGVRAGGVRAEREALQRWRVLAGAAQPAPRRPVSR